MNSIDKLIKEFTKLPGVGEKTAARFAYHILRVEKSSAFDMADAIKMVKEKISFCKQCFNLSEDELCKICADPKRDKTTVCVVEFPEDASAIEKANTFGGVYHILHGSISPLDGVGPDNLKLNELILRLKAGGIKELVLATNPTTSGEATALYISKIAKPFNIKLSRIAFGVPFGGDIEYTDKATLSRALEFRSEMR